MAKILIGVVAAVVIAAGGFFGFQLYTQHRIAGEVEAAFERIRANGSKASHGKVSFDLLSRTVTIADIASESPTQPAVSVKIASLVAAGAGQSDATRFSAETIEATDVEIDASLSGPAASHLTYKLPRVVMKDYSGPASLQQSPASASFIDVYRSLLQQFSAISASSLSIPSMVGTINLNAATAVGFTYSGLALRDIKGGKVATMQVEKVSFTADTLQAGKADKLTGELRDIAVHDFDATATAAILDPQKAADDRYYRAYGLTTTGTYTITSGQGVQARIEGLTIDDVGVRPSRLQLPALLAMLPPPGAAPPTPAQAREMMDKMASLYEGIRVGKAEMRGLSVETPQGPFKLAALRFNLENGKIGEFALEGIDTGSPNGPVKVGRFALRSLDLAGLLRVTAQFSGQKPSPDQFLALLPLLEGTELKDFVAPFKNTGKPVNISNFDLAWGQFVGPIPSRLRLTAKMTAPFDATDPGQRMLIAGGLDTAAIDADLGAAWSETSRSFALEPVALEVGGLLKASARVSLANVPREVFSLNPQQAAVMAGQIEAGTIELTLRDTGGVDILVALYARTHNVSRDDARQAIVQSIRDGSAAAVASNPDASAVVDALARFIETPRTALTLKLTPLGKVPAMQLFQMLQTDPVVALAQFRLEVSTAL